MTTPPVDMADFLSHLNMTDSEGGPHAAELALTLEAATELVESHVGPMVARTVTLTAEPSERELLVDVYPVLSVTTFTNSSGTSLAAGAEVSGGVITRYPTVLGTGRHTIVYQAGRTPVPAALKLATLIVAKHLWETQRASGSLASSGRFGATGPEMVPNTSMGFALPNRAAELMGPYMQPGIA